MATIGYYNGQVPTITADILAVVNEATQELSGNIIWDSFEYEDSLQSGHKMIQIFGQDNEATRVSYRLLVQRVGDDMETLDDEAPMNVTCTNILDCGKCGMTYDWVCYCKVPSGNAECGFCETRTYTWMGGFSNYCNAKF